LDALIEFHSPDMSDASFDALVKQIEAIVNEKFTAARIERGGIISIRQLDILRYAALNREGQRAMTADRQLSTR
jgi:hypothetical protein